jgi:hypothetical protein
MIAADAGPRTNRPRHLLGAARTRKHRAGAIEPGELKVAEHDFSLQIDKCPRCVELRSLTHDMSLPPSQCPACIEWGRERSRKSRSTHIPGILGSVDVSHVARVLHTPLPLVPPKQAAPHDTDISASMRAAYAAIEQQRAKQAAKLAADASWAEVISELNSRNRSSPACTEK